jgi:hypothetical protein
MRLKRQDEFRIGLSSVSIRQHPSASVSMRRIRLKRQDERRIGPSSFVAHMQEALTARTGVS